MAQDELELVEVGPRDGLQNEPEIVSTKNKLEFIELSLSAGLRRMEAGSFVNAKRVPQMGDSAAVFAGLAQRDNAVFIALALNLRGVERALAAGAREINYVFCASDGFSIRNNGAPVAETFEAWPDVAAAAKAGGARLSATVAMAFGCPFDGEVPVETVARIAERCVTQDIFELALADTIGVGAPRDVRERFRAVKAAIPKRVQLRAHFHNTRNTGLANAVAAVEEGVRVLDGSLGGIGGCPFAPGAAGNVPTEDLAYMFARMGFRTGVDLDRAVEAAHFIGRVLGRTPPGMVSRAPKWPTQ